MTENKYRRQCHEALGRLIEWCVTPAELARIAKVNRSTVTRWQSTGKVSREAASVISTFPGCPLTREQIRPDIKVWS
jgi:hypothetical protein